MHQFPWRFFHLQVLEQRVNLVARKLVKREGGGGKAWVILTTRLFFRKMRISWRLHPIYGRGALLHKCFSPINYDLSVQDLNLDWITFSDKFPSNKLKPSVQKFILWFISLFNLQVLIVFPFRSLKVLKSPACSFTRTCKITNLHYCL